MPDIRSELAGLVKSFVKKKYRHVQEVTINRITESGPKRGLNLDTMEGYAIVQVGTIPNPQPKRFRITVYATRDGRIVDSRGLVS